MPVDPDFLPAPLPPNFDPSLIVSIQAPGTTNFDVPAPVAFPNLDGMAPGEQALLFSFNHDAGRFEVNGTATVSDDGMSIVSDVGVGIDTPGWHGVQPGVMVDGVLHGGIGGLDGRCGAIASILGTGLQTGADIVGVASFLVGLFGSNPLSTIVSITGTVLDLQVALDNNDVESWVKVGFDVVGIIGGSNPIGQAARFSRATLAVLDLLINLENIRDQAARAQQNIDCGPNGNTSRSGAGRDSVRLISSSRAEGEQQDALARLVDSSQTLTDLLNNQRPIFEDVDSFMGRLSNLINRADFSGGPLGLSSEEQSELANLLGRFADALTQLSSEPLLGEAASNFGKQAQEVFANELTPLLDGETDGYLLFESGNRVFRQRTNEAGRFRFTLPTDELVRISAFNVDSGATGVLAFHTSDDSGGIDLPIIPLTVLPELSDADGDGLSDIAEQIIGTNSQLADSDNDGILDGAEIEQGLNPLDNRGFPTGVISSLPLPGQALDVEIGKRGQ